VIRIIHRPLGKQGSALGAGQPFRSHVATAELEFERLTGYLRRLEKLNAGLHARFISVYKLELTARAAELTALSTISEPAEADWHLLAEIQAKCDELVRESFNFIQGALARDQGIDDGICAIADRLLDGLSARSKIGWNRLTVPADSEFVTDLAQIVRLRAADVSVWNLPVAVHEFGHFIGTRIVLDGHHPFASELAKYASGSVEWSHLHEYFADIFATYVTGPALAATCVLSRFDPSDATEPSETHPSHVDRVYLMLRTLEELDRDANTPAYGALRALIRKTWGEILNAAGRPTTLDPGDQTRLDAIFTALYPIVTAGVPQLRYDGMLVAHQVKRAINEGKPAPAGASVIDVVNGAWLARIERPASDAATLRARGLIALDYARQAAA
jgi:hypothetical protein